MKKFEHFCNFKNGKLTSFEKFISGFSIFAENDRLKITVQKVYRQRSNSQNSYYWGVIIDKYLLGVLETEGRPLGLEFVNKKTGEMLYIPLSEKEQQDKAHEFLKKMFNEGRSTKDNTTAQQEEYHQFCREYIKFAYNITVELPNENLEINYK